MAFKTRGYHKEGCIMFSKSEKARIAAAVEKALLEIGHPEMPADRPQFKLHVDGKESWSWADIEPNWKYEKDSAKTTAWNENAREIMSGKVDG